MALRAMIVSPNEQIVRVLRGILLGLGVETELCADSSSAAAAFGRGNFDAVLVDWDLEALVREVPRQARQKASSSIVIVALLDARLSASQAFQQGANFVLYKPISVERAKVSLQFALKLAEDERRQKRRRPVHLGTKISFGATEGEAVTLLNLSPTGTAVQSANKLPADCKIYFDFHIPGEKSSVRMAGTVVWQDVSGRTGIRFSTLPEASRRLVEHWVEASEAAFAQQEALSREADLQTEEEDSSPRSAGEPIVVRQPIPMGNKSERRKQSRYACSSGVQVSSALSRVPHWCNLTDISLGGCYIEMTMPFPKNTQLLLELRTHATRLRTRGIVRSMNPGYGMGIQFEFDTGEQRAQLQEIIGFLAGGSSQPSEASIPSPDRRRRPRD